MCGSAMFTIVPSSTTMSCAALISVRARPRWRCAPGTTPGAWPDVVVVVAMCSPCGMGKAARSGRRGADGRQDDVVHDPGDELWGGPLAAQQHAVQHDARKYVQDEVQVEVRPHLAAVARPLEERPGGLLPRPQERLLAGGGEVGVG